MFRLTEGQWALIIPGLIPIPVLLVTWWVNRNTLRETARLAAAAVEQQFENAKKLQSGLDKIDEVKTLVDGAATAQRDAYVQLHNVNSALKNEVSRLNAGTTTRPVTETPIALPNQVTQANSSGGQVNVSGSGRREGDDKAAS